MQHWTILPILLPLLVASAMLLPPLSSRIQWLRIASIGTLAILTILATLQVATVITEGTQLYILGGWSPPFGIVLVADKVSALLVLLTSFLALCCMIYACADHDKGGEFFHPLFLFQVMGINGAFLTGDLFNLFVFFEVLLIASYALLVHSGGKNKTQAAVHYVVINLLGSSLFLFGLGILYGTLGTLNIADMAVKVSQLPESETILAKIGGLLLLIVFGLKSAMLPLQFWLSKTYSSASAPVAALFAIMTKVGIYSIFRVFTVIFGDDAGELANFSVDWLWPLAILTISIGSLGVLASPTLKLLASNLVVVSAGTLLVAAALHSELAIAGALYYIVHSTLVTAGLFLLADVIAKQRGQAEDRLVNSRALSQPKLIGFGFAILALTIIGMPPFSGFIGKIMVLNSAETMATRLWIWPVILMSSLITLVAFSRATSKLFWKTPNTKNTAVEKAHPYEVTAIVLLILGAPLLVLFGGPMTEYVIQAAADLHNMDVSVYPLLPEES
ncbi:MAG: monovalent cation/H+ antiporter subunit D [Marinomonas sp.]|uniref:monovalent cation/H+ antiporter subunit D n=1 Tax=unclassified Marinomonas TaxID=196814 RepID=UPI0007AFC28C|nr:MULTISPECIES: monovalent cation/H+ antiporter subunit D [unclassified Marinomonas]KZM39321.1 cation:proton antiporter [Marinomonas sp. SBI22]KZM40132.1 cation:proton antiporter [Marinomonas sp. SBI8L]